MQKFNYKAWDKDFTIIKGSVEEEDINAAKTKLMYQGLSVIDIQEYKNLSSLKFFKTNLKDDDLANFCGQLAIIINAGVNLLTGLDMLQNQTKNKRMKKIIEDIATGVKRGKTLATAMHDNGSFPFLLVDMVSAGEASGQIDTMLFNLETLYERETVIKNKLKSASIYPTVLLLMAIGMLVFFNSFIFKELKDLFTDTANLPLITKLLIASMNIFNTYTTAIIIGIVSIILFFKYIKTIKKVKYVFDKLALSLPIIGPVKKDILISRFTRSMGLFIKSGVPILNVFDNLKLIVDNEYISLKINQVKEDITNGNSMATSLDRSRIFEPLVVQMISVGEETGKLEETLSKLADIYDKRSEAGITKLMALVEPVFTLIIGVFVAILILAMALPVFQMTNTTK